VNRCVTLIIRPVKLKRSVYFRVPNDIADLISIEDDSHVTLTLEERNDRYLLVYSVFKNKPLDSSVESEVYPLQVPMQQSTNRPGTTAKL